MTIPCQNESASQSEDRRAGKYELLKALVMNFCPRINISEQIDITKENTLVAPGAVVVTEQFVFYWCVQ
jgi:hypothetical protein